MLPMQLIEACCSLDPNRDRRTVSAIFVITETGDVLDSQITRGLIRSCAKLSYETAQVGSASVWASMLPSTNESNAKIFDLKKCTFGFEM